MVTENNIDKFREAGKIAAAVREFGKGLIEPGVRLAEIVEACDDKIRELGGEPAFPSQISPNHIAAHYCPAPDDPSLAQKGDILKLDIGAHVDGYVADNAVTVDLKDGPDSQLALASKLALENVIASVGPGITVSELGRIVNDTISALGFKPVYNLTGHGVGRYTVHCAPQVPNYDDKRSIRLRAGQVVAIEPFATTGKGYIDEVGEPQVFQLKREAKKRDKLPLDVQEALNALHGLPFARRDLHRFFDVKETEKVLRLLNKKKILHNYPPLAEKPGTRISQHEHTIMILEEGIEVTTLHD